jgi:hypothetical protein
MNAIKTIGTVVIPVTVWIAAGCNDRGKAPTDPSLEVGQNGMSSSRGDDGRGGDGSGSSFRIFGNARLTRDPENRSNVVLEVVSTAAGRGAGAFRELRRVQLWQLDHQLNFKWAFVAPHTCGGGSPRISLLIDADGNGKFEQAPKGPDFAAHGHVRPPFTGCESTAPTGSPNGPSMSTLRWGFEDLTDELVRWEITPSTAIPGRQIGPIGGAGAVNWDALEQIVSDEFPKHRVLRGTFLEDFSTAPGTAYYDLITIFDRTLGTRGQVQPERGGNNGGDDDDDSDDDSDDS